MSCIEFAIIVQYGGLSLWACLEINKHCTILCFPTKVWMWQTHKVVPTHPPDISMNQCTCPHDPLSVISPQSQLHILTLSHSR